MNSFVQMNKLIYYFTSFKRIIYSLLKIINEFTETINSLFRYFFNSLTRINIIELFFAKYKFSILNSFQQINSFESVDNKLVIFCLIFPKETGFDISCKVTPISFPENRI